jgi:hypothetical protein
MKSINKIVFISFFAGCIAIIASSCGPYSFRDATVPPEVKTIKIQLFENRARYVNAQLSARLTDAFNQKVSRQTKLSRTNDDDAHYIVGGYISQYDVTTAGISAQQSATNRLTVGVHIILRKTLDNKTDEYDVSRSFDFPASLSLPQAEAQLLDDIIRNVSDEIFNRIFSNW